MFNFDKDALIELGKSFLRAVWFGILGVLVTALFSLASSESLMNAVWCWGDLCLQVGVMLAAGVAGLAKLIDRYIHKSENTDLNGIAPSFLQR